MAHSAAFQGVREDNSVAVKQPGCDSFVYCPVWEIEKKIMRHSIEYNISSSGEKSTKIEEYISSYSASSEHQVFQREEEMWNEVSVLAQAGWIT